MRIIVRLAVALALIVAAGLAALAFFLPRIIESDAVRARIRAAGRAALGRDIQYEDLDFGLLPPSLLIVRPAVAGEDAGGPAFADAEGIALRVAVKPLLAQTVVVDSLVVEGATVRLVRTKDGIRIPGADRPEAGAGGEADGEDESALGFALRGFELRGSTVILEDRAVSPPVTWELRNVTAKAQGESFDAPFEFEISVDVASGGHLQGRGTATLDGDIDLTLQLEGFGLAPLASYAKETGLGGALSGSVRAKGPVANPTSLVADLTVADGRFEVDEIAVVGAVGVKADVSGGFERPDGTFEMDATGAELRYGGAFVKPTGTAATMNGRILTHEDGSLGIETEKLRVKNLDAEASLRSGERTRVVVRTPMFDIGGWDALVPALAGFDLHGGVQLEEVAIVTPQFDARGRIRVDGLSMRVTDLPEPLTLTGDILAEGNVLRTTGLALRGAGQEARIDATLRDLAEGAARYRVRIEMEDADTNSMVATYSGKPDVLHGPLNLRSDLTGSLAGDAQAQLASLDGGARFDITNGRLVGVSFLNRTFGYISRAAPGALGTLGGLLGTVTQVFTGFDVSRFDTDRFDSMSATLMVEGGHVRTQDFRLVYPDYSVDLRGSIRLRDLALDMEGGLTLGPAIQSALARGMGGDGAVGASGRRISLASVRGTLDAPEVRASDAAVVALVRSYLPGVLGGAMGGFGKGLGTILGGDRDRDGSQGGRRQR